MKKIIFLLIAIISSLNVIQAQTADLPKEPANYRSAANKFVSAYNDEKIKEMCDLFTPELVKLLPKDRMDLLIGVLKLQFGKITKHRFNGFENRNNRKLAKYHANLEHGELDIAVSLNASNLVDFIWFVPDEKTEQAAKMLQQMFNINK